MVINERRRIRQSLASRLFDWSNYIFLIGLSVISFYPLWYEISLSLSSKTEALRGGLFFWPREFTLDAYVSVLESSYIWSAYRNSLFVTIIGTVLSVLVTSATAYPLNKTTLLWRKVWISLILFTMLFNGGLIPTYMVVKSLGLIDSLWALIFLNIVSAFNLIIVMNFMRTIPEELDESAMIDGANPIRIFFSITLPLCKPVLATLALWTGVGLWNNFMQALIYLNKKSLMTLPLLLKQIIAGQELLNETGQLADSSTESVIAATIMVAIIPILGIYPFLQRYFTKGIMLGSIKS